MTRTFLAASMFPNLHAKPVAFGNNTKGKASCFAKKLSNLSMSYASCNIQENRIEEEEKEVKERSNDFRQVIREENDQQQ